MRVGSTPLSPRSPPVSRPAHPARRSCARLSVTLLEDRVVPDGRPLPFPTFYLAADTGHAPVVKAYDAEHGTLNFERTVYDPAFLGGVRVAAGDFTQDGFPDVVVSPGPGGGPNVRILDGKSGEQVAGPLGSFWAYAPTFTGGVHVAVALVDGDGVPDVVTAAGTGGGPHVRVFSGATGAVLAEFFAFDPDFLGGVTVAAADLDGDGMAEVAVGAGEGGGPRVRVYDPLAGAPVAGPLGSFFAFDPAQRGGVTVGTDSMAGDLDGDGVADLAVGTGPGTAPRVRVFSGVDGSVLREVAPFDDLPAGGVRAALAYVTDDPFADVVAGTGPGTAATVRVFDGQTGQLLPPPQGEYVPFGTGPGASGGVRVAASNDPITPGVSTPTSNPGTATSYSPFTVRGEVFTPQYPPMNTPTGTLTFKVRNLATGVWTTLGTSTLAPILPQGRAAADLTYTAGLPAGSYDLSFLYSGDAMFNARGSLLGGMAVHDPQIIIESQSITSLRVAKWQDAFVDSWISIAAIKGPDSKTNWDFIDRDPDRFNVWVYDRGKWEVGDKHTQAKISTTNEAGFTKYNDDPTAVDFVRYTGSDKGGGWYWSDSQMLVSNDIDDDYESAPYLQVDDAGPGAEGLPKNGYGPGFTWLKSDRTHTVALRGKIHAEYAAGGKTVIDTKTVPVTKVVNVHALCVTLGVGNPPWISTADAVDAINKANEQYAQVGILLVPTADNLDAPAKLNLGDGLKIGTDNKYDAEEIELFSGLTVPPQGGRDRIEMFFINYFTARPDLAGLSYTASGASEAKYADVIVMPTQFMGPLTIGHEIGHILLDPGYDLEPTSAKNWVSVMYKKEREDTVTGPKRFTPDEQARMLSARLNLLKPPPP